MPNRAEALEWEGDSDAPLRTAIIDAALAIADEEGLGAVSVRRVADRIGRRPMSLYSHVPSKDGLIALMFDRVSAEMLVPEPLPDSGRELLHLVALRAFETYLAHPWMLHAFGHRPPPGPNQMRRGEQSARAVRALGVTPRDAWTALSIVHEWTMGHALHVVTLREDPALAGVVAQADLAELPEMARAHAAHTERSPQKQFERALAVVVDGIEEGLT